MIDSAVSRAVSAAKAIASSAGLSVDDAVVLHDSNALTLRLLPCDTVARVAPAPHENARFELDLASQLATADCPIGVLEPRVEPRVYERDGFVVTLWSYYESVTSSEISPADYADALHRLHVGMRALEYPVPHYTDRVESAQRLVADPQRTPDLQDSDRELLAHTLTALRASTGAGGGQQLLHGEPHPGNLLSTNQGLVFIDLETCCGGPIEFDLAHAPEQVAQHYPGADQELLQACRLLVLAMITTWRWDRDDRYPDGRRLGVEWLDQLRALLAGRW